MKIKNYPCLLTDEELKAEIERLERRPYNGASKWATRLFDLRQELKRRSTPPPAKAAQ